MPSVDTVRDFFRFLTGHRISFEYALRPLWQTLKNRGANAVSYPCAVTESGNGSRKGHGGHGVVGGLGQMLRCDFRLVLKIERRPVKAADFAVLRGSVDKELEPSAFRSHGCSGAQMKRGARIRLAVLLGLVALAAQNASAVSAVASDGNGHLSISFGHSKEVDKRSALELGRRLHGTNVRPMPTVRSESGPYHHPITARSRAA